MKIGAPKEVFEGEKRVAMTPQSAAALQKLGYECIVETGAGAGRALLGRRLCRGRRPGRARPPPTCGTRPTSSPRSARRPTPRSRSPARDQIVISFVYPGQSAELLEALKAKDVTTLAMDMVPRISRAQKMDALSSMANIAGYRAVIEAGNNFGRFFTGQVTAAGKVPPAKVLVVGAGVAGLAAIGTAVSLGAIVYAFDVRPEVAEQIESMGAEFVFLEFEQTQDLAATGGYAAPSSPEFREKQLAKFRELAPEIDIVITTALIPGRPAPKLWTEDMVALMKPGSVIVDLAAERGGNCDLTVPDQAIETPNGVRIIGYTDFPSRMATQASTLYANNVRHMMDDLTPGEGRDGRSSTWRTTSSAAPPSPTPAPSPSRRRRPRSRRSPRRSRRRRPSRRPTRRRPRASSPSSARRRTARPRSSSSAPRSCSSSAPSRR